MSKRLVFFIVLSLIAFGVMLRLAPHLPNATPLTAIAFVSSFYLRTKWSIILPVLVLLISDFVIGFYDWRIMASVYLSFLLIGVLGWLSRKYSGLASKLFFVIGSSLFFFLITNATVWAFSPWYEKSVAGLLYAYELGIPFFRSMLIGDFVYGFLLILVFETCKFLWKAKNWKFKIRHV